MLVKRRFIHDDNRFHTYAYVNQNEVIVFVGIGHARTKHEVPPNPKLKVLVERGEVELVKLDDGLGKGAAGIAAAKLITQLRPKGRLLNHLHHDDDASGALSLFEETLSGVRQRVDNKAAYA